MTDLQRYSDYYRSGPYRGIEQTHCQVGGVVAGMFMARDRPAGSFSEPAVASASLQLAVAGRGPCVLDLGAGRFQAVVQPGSWVIGPAVQSCHYTLSSDLDLLVLELPADLMRQLSPHDDAMLDFGSLHATLSEDPLISNLTKAIWEVNQSLGSSGDLWTDSALLTLVGHLLSLGSRPVPSCRGGLSAWQLRRVTEMMAADLSGKIKLSDLANEVRLSPFHFIRAFKQSQGAPPHRHRTRLRIEAACRLLETTDAPVTEIALQVGYESSQALARIFARDLGVTPTQWRRDRRR